MLPFVIGLLTFFLVLDCVILIFLVLIQLPKKEAGAGLAFGGSATDALFGAGSGNVLTKITKYAAGIFFALAILLALLQKKPHGNAALMNLPARPAPSQSAPAPAPGQPLAPSGAAPTMSGLTQPSTNPSAARAESTNLPATPVAPPPGSTNK